MEPIPPGGPVFGIDKQAPFGENSGMFDKLAAYSRIHSEMAPALSRIEEAINAHIDTRAQLAQTISLHVIGSGGKRLRPLLMVIAARLCGYRDEDYDGLAVVIEFLHSATLLHDDVLDGAAVRRGKPAANARWGSSAAVLSGDFLFSRAFSILVERYNREITALMIRTAIDMIDGEVIELAGKRNAALTVGEYEKIIGLKTASLIAASCRAGALLAGADREKIEALSSFGHRIGMAFQIIDDVLDYTGDPAVFGKVPGGDLREGAVTLPLIICLERLGEADRALVADLVTRGAVDDASVSRVIACIRESGADKAALAVADRHVTEARALLGSFGADPHRAMLDLAADYVISRRV
jgi:octaprenyl-diphosphate synthase